MLKFLKIKRIFIDAIFSLALVGILPMTSRAACDQTLSPSSNLTSAISSAANGATICLATGDYGTLKLTDISRSGMVTVQSATGLGATLSATISNSKFIKLQSLTLHDMMIQNCSSNIQLSGNTWVQDTSGIVVFDYGYNCSNTNKQILIDGNTFVNVQPSWSEGRIGLVSVNGVTFSNNLIMGQSVGHGGDGIQTGGSSSNVMIGPGNIFRHIRQAACDATPGVPHCDSIQFVGDCPTCTINGNWFDDVEVVLQHHDATVPVVFTNNLITNAIQMWAYSDPGDASNSRIEHNTFYNLGLVVWGTNGSGVSDTTGLIGRNNLLIGSTAQPSTCKTPSCTFTYNLCQSASVCGFNTLGTLVGTPAFMGGAEASITTWAGWQLTAASIGYKKGSDGLDIGTNYYGPTTVALPPVTFPPISLSPPSNLRLISTVTN